MTDEKEKQHQMELQDALKRKKRQRRERKQVEEENYFSDMAEELEDADYNLDQNVLNKLRKR